jgi:hypothetical protein
MNLVVVETSRLKEKQMNKESRSKSRMEIGTQARLAAKGKDMYKIKSEFDIPKNTIVNRPKVRKMKVQHH